MAKMCDDEPTEIVGNGLMVPGGWCAPSEMLYDAGPNWTAIYHSPVGMPDVSVARGGIEFPKPPEPGTPEWHIMMIEQREREAMNAFITRHVGDMVKAQDSAMDSAIFTALFEGWEVHFQKSYSSRFVGIAFRPRSRGTLVTYHEDGWWWENLEDYDDE